jgi:hypothetical protein
MMVDLKVMAYFKLSLSTHNWDRALKKGVGWGGDEKNASIQGGVRPAGC